VTLACVAGAVGTSTLAVRDPGCARALKVVPSSFTNSRKENAMNRRTTLAMTTTALLCLAVGLSTSDSLAQQKSLKEQLVGTWTLVSSDQVRPDGSKLKQFGANPKGIDVFDANGRFFLMIASADNSKNFIQRPEQQDEHRESRWSDSGIDGLLRHIHGQRRGEGCHSSS
jgi:hypothetical protein